MSNLTITPINDRSQWDAFIADIKPNTFLQSWEWGEVQLKDSEQVERWGIYREATLIGCAQVIAVNARRGKHWLIPHGPLWRSDADAVGGLNDFVSFLRSRASEAQVVALRIAPLLVTSPEHKALFTQLGFRPAPLHVHTELTWVLDITPQSEQLLQGMRKTTRHAIRKAEKAGVMCEIITNDTGIERFLPLYEATKERHGFVPFTASFLKNQFTTFNHSGQAFIAVATHEGRDMAAAILIHSGDTVFYHHGASINVLGSVPAAQLLQWSAIQEAKRRGAKLYNFWGIAPDDQPHHPFAGITIFKKGFGGHAIDYLHAQDLLLSSRYWLLWAVDSWRKFRRGF